MHRRAERELVIFIVTDSDDEFYFYRQAFAEVCPVAILYFFTRKGDLLDALKAGIYPKPVLILMDWNMAARKGYVALSWLAQSPVWQTVPVVIMTSALKPVDEAKCTQLDYELVLPKETTYAKQLQQLRGLVRAFV
ncbi:response regulator [Spirosoma fluviale]|uniref:CheY chemotaxis protein or a CheY-like REC (Receiver) domain n=1 Tax=Spirosoma fluviale TaxID=1597977 RepID=A0A286G4P4_9BACT|nr:response regulator [Spirosoma fluviale]SOD89944.1 CheY chemotaxis protein or a CheY-like REC (receiver) domain [Spirosoma fluviale]